MKKSEHLYGKEYEPSRLASLGYEEGFRYKNDCANALLVELFKEEYAKNNTRIRDIYKAIDFNLEMIDEIYRTKEQEEDV